MTSVRIADVLRLERRSVVPDPLTEYTLIGIYSFGKGIFHREPMVGADLGDYRFFEISPGDLVISNIQAWEGAIAVASERDRRCIGTHRFLTYVATDDRVDTSYLRYYFLSSAGSPQIQRASPGSVTRNRTLATDRFENLVISLPNLDQQRSMAARLDRELELLGRLAKGQVAASGDALLMLYPALVDAILRRHAAAEVVLGDVVELAGESVQAGDDPAPADQFIGLEHVERHTGRIIGSRSIDGPETGPKTRFAPGDVLYPRLRPYLNKAWATASYGLCSVDQFVLRPRQGMDPELLAHAMRGRSVLQAATGLTSSLQLPRIRKTDLLSIRVAIVPPQHHTRARAELDQARAQVVRLLDLRRQTIRVSKALQISVLNAAF